MKIKWYWSEIILDFPQKNTFPFLKSYRITFSYLKNNAGERKEKKKWRRVLLICKRTNTHIKNTYLFKDFVSFVLLS